MTDRTVLPRGSRPNCRYCGVELRLFQFRHSAWAKKLKRSPYGKYGDGLFCTKECGHNWAVMTLRKQGARS